MYLRVVIEVLIIWILLGGLIWAKMRREHVAPADDLGVLWFLSFALYTTLPPLLWLGSDGYYDASAGSRLFELQPSVAEVTSTLELAIPYAIGFALPYIIMTSSVPRRPAANFPLIPDAHVYAALGILASVRIVSIIAVAVGVVRSSTSYIDSYASVQEAGIGLRQLLKVANGAGAVAQMVVLVGLLQQWPRRKRMSWLYFVAVALTFDPDGSRRGVATGLFAAAVAWHMLVRPISAPRWTAGAGAALLAFLIIGVRRDTGSWNDALSHPGGGEFNSLWANNIELLRLAGSGQLHLDVTTRFGEFFAFLPSQVLPFEKTSLSIWFVQTYHPAYAEQGGGWAFGAIAQVIVGGGALEALMRGAAIALGARMAVAYTRMSGSWWRLPAFLYVHVFIYEAVRDTSFRALTDLVQIVIPTLLAIELFARVQRR